VAECKWEKVRSARTRFAAAKLLDWALIQAQQGTLRLDALTWDTEVASRAGQGVPHITNLRKMYRALLERVTPARWGSDASWQLYPDEQSAMPWERLIAGLPQIASVTVCRSHEQPLIQLADLFAGLAVYSRDGYDLYERWLCDPPELRGLSLVPPDENDPTARYSASDRARCLLLDDFFTTCKFRHLGVSLRTRRGLFTGDPAKPLAFHWWMP
jgi:hypothetical protein